MENNKVEDDAKTKQQQDTAQTKDKLMEYQRKFDQFSEDNKKMLSDVEAKTTTLKGYLESLEQGKLEIEQAEYQIAALAKELTNSKE